MTISSLTNRKIQVSDGVQLIFAYDFLILDTDHLVLYHNSDLDTPLTGFTVDGIGNQGGGNATFTVAPAAGNIVLNREVPLIQAFDYITGGKFPASTHERLADLLVMMAQRLEDESGRSVKLPLDATQTDLVFPNPAAGKTIIGKVDESGWEDGPTIDEISNAQTEALNSATSAGESATSAGDSATSASEAAISAAEMPTLSAGDANKHLRVNVTEDGYDFYNVTVSLAAPSGGSDNDVWFQYE